MSNSLNNITPEEHIPSGIDPIGFSRIDNVLPFEFIKREKNKFYFDDFFNDDVVEYKRKYQNDWSELREYVGFNDIDLVDNELVIVNMSGLIKIKTKIKKYAINLHP